MYVLGYVRPPVIEDILPPFETYNLGMLMGTNFLGLEGFEKRTSFAFLNLESVGQIKNTIYTGSTFNERDGEGHVLSDEPATSARITNFFSQSEAYGGPAFTLTGLMPESGAYFNPDIGEFGGWRIDCNVDVLTDNGPDTLGDIDGVVTLLVELTQEVDENELTAEYLINSESLCYVNPKVLDNVLTIRDYESFFILPILLSFAKIKSEEILTYNIQI